MKNWYFWVITSCLVVIAILLGGILFKLWGISSELEIWGYRINEAGMYAHDSYEGIKHTEYLLEDIYAEVKTIREFI